jgi:trehalose 6-phosphate phosphatase
VPADVFGPAGREALVGLAAGRTLAAFDFDGTLAPIARQPEEAALPASTRHLLLEVARRYPCAVISGRPLSDIQRKVAGIPLLAVAGSHGAERGGPAAAGDRGRGEEWFAALTAALSGRAGIVLERKPAGVAVHYRGAPDGPLARALVRAALEHLPGGRLLEGKKVMEIVPAEAPTKGDALLGIRAAGAFEAMLYVGDDVTDEDAFACAPPAELVSVRVGSARASRARFALSDQKRIDRLLAVLLALRGASRPRVPATTLPVVGIDSGALDTGGAGAPGWPSDPASTPPSPPRLR